MLEHGWAYGSQGTALAGKRFLSVVTAGGGAAAYQREGYNRFTVRELLAPLEQTARLCRMEFVPPYVIHGTHQMTDGDIAREVARYRELLSALHDDRVDFARASHHQTLNDALDRTHDGAHNGAHNGAHDAPSIEVIA